MELDNLEVAVNWNLIMTDGLLKETQQFEGAIKEVVYTIKEALSETDFQAFVGNAINILEEYIPDSIYIENIKNSTIINLKDVEQLFIILYKKLIKINLKNAVLEFFTWLKQLPQPANVFSIYEYKRTIKNHFAEYKCLHDIMPEVHYLLKEIIYEEASNFTDYNMRECGRINFYFCLYDNMDG